MSPTSPTPTGSRRRRLWDLPHQCLCPVVGVCLPLDVLRRLVNKALGGRAVADDYEVHVGAVAQCQQRNRLSEALQTELEARYPRQVQSLRAVKTTEALAEQWAAAVLAGDVAGLFWATLTHPRCDDLLQELVLRDMHMLQHQAGAAARVDASRFQALLHENGVLGRELAKAQDRCTRVIAEKSLEVERLMTEVMALRASHVGKDSQMAFLAEDLQALRASIPGLGKLENLQKKLAQMAARQSDLDAQNADLRQTLSRAMKLIDERDRGTLGMVPAAPEPDIEPPPVQPVTVYLRHQTVLCVGGRTGSVASYRDVIERVGGRFAHHDGGLQDAPAVLDASLAAADLVICQTGCISHNAYWRVKDFCKRTGKRCVFVDNPSTSSLVRTLGQMAVGDMVLQEGVLNG